MDYAAEVAVDLSLDEKGVAAAIKLFDEDATVPFVARYRKEATGGLDEVQLSDILSRLEFLRKLQQRRETILKTIEEQGKLTDELKKKIEAAREMAVLEDLYLPYKPKRKTRASAAIEKGLEPLADLIWEQGIIDGDPDQAAGKYVNEEKGVADTESAWAGARDIVAERISEIAELRADLRSLYMDAGQIASKVKKGKEKDGANFKDYFDFDEPVKSIPSHRMLAIRRGETEGFLSFRITIDKERAMVAITGRVLIGDGGTLKTQLLEAAEDSFDRLLAPSIEGHTRNELRDRADREAIKVFTKNLRNLLMSPPLGGKWVLAIDPGIRTGCKMVALDGKGDLLASTVIFPLGAAHEAEKAAAMVESYCQRYRIEAVAIGNGTGGRETEKFFRKLGRDRINDADIVLVSESGASVYSASEIAREEFPDQDLTVRGAISIGRRLQDPLAELVKIDPKSIGVGQYQHDVDQDNLKGSLDGVVVSCVNAVGVELNTASGRLLKYISGLNTTQAGNIVQYRSKNGNFKNRKQLMDVPRLGPKAFEQAAGFLRIRSGENPLDASAVHPERYALVEKMAADLDADVAALMSDTKLREQIKIENYISDEVGEPTLRDILAELSKPGRDPRPPLEPVRFDPEITEVSDLSEGQILEGVVTNVTNFGAFVDVGVHQDGLVHISELSHEFVDDPSKVLSVEQRVKVKVIEVDAGRNRISLSIKQTTDPPKRPPRPAPQQKQRRHSGDRRPHQGGRQKQRHDRRQKREPRQVVGNKKATITSNPFAALSMEGGKLKLNKDKKGQKKK